jgi:hypothetical protein
MAAASGCPIAAPRRTLQFDNSADPDVRCGRQSERLRACPRLLGLMDTLGFADLRRSGTLFAQRAEMH